jgi:hypothetical protein
MNKDNNTFDLHQSGVVAMNSHAHSVSKVFIFLAMIGLVTMSTSEAAFEGYKPETLVSASNVIVKAEMIGSSEIIINHDHVIVLGVLRVDKVLKGDVAGDVIFLRLPGPEMEDRSDRMDYKKGQSGWWFLTGSANASMQGIYRADHPQRFSDDPATMEWLQEYLD